MYSRPLPSRCARHPPPERGWAGNMEERTTPLSLASHRLRGEGDHEVVEGGGLQWRPVPAKRAIKLIARRAIPPPFEPACQRQAEPSEPSEPGPQSGPYSRPFPSRCARHSPSEWQAMLNHLRAHRKVCPCFEPIENHRPQRGRWFSVVEDVIWYGLFCPRQAIFYFSAAAGTASAGALPEAMASLSALAFFRSKRSDTKP